MCVLVGLPPVPVTVKLKVPLRTLAATVTVKAEDSLAGSGLKKPLAPAGRRLMERVTGELNVPFRVMVTV